MMQSELKRITATLLAVLFVLGLAVPAAVAWFASVSQIDNATITAGSIANYFAGGDGSETNPYLLTNANHVYNLTWLQNKGVFEEPKYFKLNADIDMSTLQGDGARSAVPPIGTTANPFTGYFDGNGKTVSNLWVSSDENDWKRKPETYTGDIGSDIGFFGAIGGSADVKNFYLKDVEVTTHVDGHVGLIAGTLNASMSQVGVVNGKITAKAAVSLNSQYSLIGKTESGVDWPDRPSDTAGGDLVITPTDYDDIRTNHNSTVASGTTLAVSGAVPGTAYFSGQVNVTTPGAGSPVFYDMTQYQTDGTYSVFEVDVNAPNKLAQEKVLAAYQDYFTSKRYLYSNGVPSATDTNTVTIDGESKQIPKNGVWFKPMEAGIAALAFGKANNNADKTMAIYKYQRNADGSLTQVEKKEFVLPKSGFKNAYCVYYEYEITEEDVAAGYEYVIGAANAASADDKVGFLAMALAGTDTTGGGSAGGTGKKLEKIDFLPAVPQTFPETVHLSSLEISGTSSAGQTFCFNAQDDGLVHYYTDGSAALVEKVTTNPESVREDSPASFPAIPSSG